MSYDLVVLAGGGATRLGGVDKVTLPLAGISPLERLLCTAADAGNVVVVGPPRQTSREVTWCLEEPAGSGPLAAVAAAFPYLRAPTVVVAAGDMPSFGEATRTLLAALEDSSHADAAVLIDETGIRQPLAAAYRRDALVRRVRELGQLTGRPARLLLEEIQLVDVPAVGASADVDTWDDVHRIEQELRKTGDAP